MKSADCLRVSNQSIVPLVFLFLVFLNTQEPWTSNVVREQNDTPSWQILLLWKSL